MSTASDLEAQTGHGIGNVVDASPWAVGCYLEPEWAPSQIAPAVIAFSVPEWLGSDFTGIVISASWSNAAPGDKFWIELGSVPLGMDLPPQGSHFQAFDDEGGGYMRLDCDSPTLAPVLTAQLHHAGVFVLVPQYAPAGAPAMLFDMFEHYDQPMIVPDGFSITFRDPLGPVPPSPNGVTMTIEVTMASPTTK